MPSSTNLPGAIDFVSNKFNQLTEEGARQLSDLKQWATTEINKGKGNFDLYAQEVRDQDNFFNNRHLEDSYWEEFDARQQAVQDQVQKTLGETFGLSAQDELTPEEKKFQSDFLQKRAKYEGITYLEAKRKYFLDRDRGIWVSYGNASQSTSKPESTFDLDAARGASLPPLPDGPSFSIADENKSNYGEGVSKEINEGKSTAKIGNWASAMYDAVGETNLTFFGEINKAVKQGVSYTKDSLVSGFNKAVELGQKGTDWIIDSFKRDPVGTTAKGVAIAAAIGVAIVIGPPILSAAGTIIGGGAALGKALLAPLGLGGLGSLIGGLGTGGVVGGLVGITLKSIIPWGLQAVGTLWNFNWNITDTEIRQQQEAMKLSLIRQLGGATGASLGRLICGGLGVATVAVFNKTAAAEIAATLGSEMGDEIFSEWAAFLQTGARLAIQSIAMSAYSSFRACIKAWAKQDSAFRKHFPEMSRIIDKWGEPGSKAWSFAIEWENYIERLEKTNKEAAAFLEEFAEEFGEGCSDSLLALSY